MPAITTKFKLQATAGRATPAPPWGPTIGQHGLNIQEIVQKFNAMTGEMGSDVIPVEVTVYADRTYSLQLKTPAAAELLKKAAKVGKGSATPNLNKVGTITAQQLTEIAEKKMADLSARDLEAAKKTIAGTARSMGIIIE